MYNRGMLIINMELNNMEKTILTEERKKELDSYTEEQVLYLWNVFTQAEVDYIEKTDQLNKESK